MRKVRIIVYGIDEPIGTLTLKTNMNFQEIEEAYHLKDYDYFDIIEQKTPITQKTKQSTITT